MQTILQILSMAGGWHPGLSLRIKNLSYMALVIEALDESGPMGLPALSVCHYGERNGDPMCDPEMRFELGRTGRAHLNPSKRRRTLFLQASSGDPQRRVFFIRTQRHY